MIKAGVKFSFGKYQANVCTWLVHSSGDSGAALNNVRGEIAQYVGARAEVAQLFEQVGEFDILVNDIWGGEYLTEWDKPVWEHSLTNGLRILRLAIEAPRWTPLARDVGRHEVEHDREHHVDRDQRHQHGYQNRERPACDPTREAK